MYLRIALDQPSSFTRTRDLHTDEVPNIVDIVGLNQTDYYNERAKHSLSPYIRVVVDYTPETLPCLPRLKTPEQTVLETSKTL